MPIQDNPYSTMINTLRRDQAEHSAWPWRLDKVVSVEPLVIETGGVELKGDDLWVNYQLRENEEPVILEEISGALNGSVNCSVGNTTSMSVASGTLEASGIFGGVLHEEDQVLLLQSEDGQTFVVACKVVKA